MPLVVENMLKVIISYHLVVVVDAFNTFELRYYHIITIANSPVPARSVTKPGTIMAMTAARHRILCNQFFFALLTAMCRVHQGKGILRSLSGVTYIASSGQSLSQRKHDWQSLRYAMKGLFILSSILRTSIGQLSTHIPHPLHNS